MSHWFANVCVKNARYSGVERVEQQDSGVQVGEQPVDLHARAHRQKEREPSQHFTPKKPKQIFPSYFRPVWSGLRFVPYITVKFVLTVTTSLHPYLGYFSL